MIWLLIGTHAPIHIKQIKKVIEKVMSLQHAHTCTVKEPHADVWGITMFFKLIKDDIKAAFYIVVIKSSVF